MRQSEGHRLQELRGGEDTCEFESSAAQVFVCRGEEGFEGLGAGLAQLQQGMGDRAEGMERGEGLVFVEEGGVGAWEELGEGVGGGLWGLPEYFPCSILGSGVRLKELGDGVGDALFESGFVEG